MNLFTHIKQSMLWSFFILLGTMALPQVKMFAQTQATYYVDPINGNDASGTTFKTLDSVRKKIRTVNTNMTGDIYVYLKGGTHQLTSTLNFTNLDGGTNGYKVIYAAASGEKPVISGGRKITGWVLNDACKNIYRAYAGNLETRQLYVNGKRAVRARSTVMPSLTFQTDGYTANGNVFANSTIPMHQWENQGDIEFVYNIVFTAPRGMVGTITNDGTTTTIAMSQSSWHTLTNRGGVSVSAQYPPQYMENAYELLDAEGEWYLNRSKDSIYYKPRADEDINFSEVIAPVLEELVRVQGADVSNKAQNIVFSGITFAHSTWLRPNTWGGVSDSQNNVAREYRQEIMGGAVNLKYTNSVKFERNVFEHLGGNGLNMYAGCQDNLVVGCRFTDISAGGIQVGNYLFYNDASSEDYANPSDARLVLRNNDIYNTYLADCGREYFSASTIGSSFPVDMDIVHNEIGNCPYSGIHIGWGWGTVTTAIKNVTVNKNYIHEVDTVLDDGGPIYTNGKTSGNSTLMGGYFNENYLVNVPKPAGHAMYNDAASNWYKWDNNVINAATYYAWDYSCSNIIFDHSYTNSPSYDNTGSNCTITNTTLVSGTNWPAAAQTIIDNAGLESEYLDMKPAVVPFYQKLFENFDALTTGNSPINWIVNAAGGDGTVAVENVPSATDKSMQLAKTATTSGMDLSSAHKLAPLYSGTLEVKAKASQTNAVMEPIILKSGTTSAVEIAFNSDGQIAYKNTSGVWTAIQSYTADTWYDFKIEFDAVSKTYNLYIGDAQKLSNAAFASAGDSIDALAHQINAASTGTLNIDNINVYEGYSARSVVSLNKTVTGFSSQLSTTNWKATNINDGLVGSTTSNERGWASASGSGIRNEWVNIDLGQWYTLSSLVVKNEDGATGRNVKDYVLYGSATGAFGGEEFVISSGTIPSLASLASYTVNFTPVDTRYIKFKATSSYSNYVIVGELSLYGVSAPTPVLPTVVSVNKMVTGFSSQLSTTNWKATNINDGMVGSTTSNERGWASVSGSGTRNEWVKIDLGQWYSLSSFVIQNEDGANGRNVKDYVLYGSATGAFAGEEFVISSGTIPALASLASYTVNFTAVDARYIKFKGTSSYSSYVIVGELSLYGLPASPPPSPTVVSLNKTVTGFSSQLTTNNWKATNINDGMVGSTTSNERGWASISGVNPRNEWVNIDLGQTYSLSSFVIQNEDGGTGRNVKDYILYGSATGAFAGEEFVISSGTIPSLTSLATSTVNFTPVSARYIKFKATSSYSNYVIVGELSLYGL